MQAVSRNSHFTKDNSLFEAAFAKAIERLKMALKPGVRDVPKPAMKQEPASGSLPERNLVPSSDHRKLPAFLITSDDSLWAALGALPWWVPKQVDAIDELIATIPSGQAGVVLLDARGQPAPAAALSRLQMHSDRFAVVVLDTAENAGAWAVALEQRQIVAHIALPFPKEVLDETLSRAREEINAREALLGVAGTTATPPAKQRLLPWAAAAILIAVLGTFAANIIALRRSASPVVVKPSPEALKGPQAPGKAPAADEQLDALIDRAQQAMLNRHYLDPAEGSALSLYREALTFNPSSGEAIQGLQRLAEILIAKAQSALDERKFEVALQALEIARGITPGDSRLAALDARVAGIRAELGPLQIQAALNSDNFDRALQLIDEAARTKAVGPAKLAQLREDVRRRRERAEINRLIGIFDARLLQDRLIDPPNDSAAFYLAQAQKAGASAQELETKYQEFTRRALPAAHAAIEQRRFGDAEGLLIELRGSHAPNTAIAALQRDLNTARGSQAQDKPDQSQWIDLARTRLAQGRAFDPPDDSALHYVNQLRVVDPQNAALAQLSSAIQAQILDGARSALRAGDTAKADTLVQLAGGLGKSADINTLNEELSRAKTAPAAAGPANLVPTVAESSLTRLKPLVLRYPSNAVANNTQGWVEIRYTVTASGTVTDVNVVDASPAGIFDSAATDAISQLHYAPFVKDGNPIAVETKLRLKFRLEAAR